jgi:hypothetical protein
MDWRTAPGDHRTARNFGSDAVGKEKSGPCGTYGIGRVPHLKACRFIEPGRFRVNGLGIEEADVPGVIFRRGSGGEKPFPPSHPVGGAPFIDTAAGRKPAGKKRSALPSPFSWPRASGPFFAKAGPLTCLENRPGMRALPVGGRSPRRHTVVISLTTHATFILILPPIAFPCSARCSGLLRCLFNPFYQRTMQIQCLSSMHAGPSRSHERMPCARQGI